MPSSLLIAFVFFISSDFIYCSEITNEHYAIVIDGGSTGSRA